MAKPEKPLAKRTREARKKLPLSDAERHKRFIKAAQEVDADEDPEVFDRAFANVVAPSKPMD